MKKLIILSVFAVFAMCANAAIVQKIVLKNGTVLNGFIRQDDGLGKMTVNTDNAVICVKNFNTTISGDKLVGESTLAETWKTWAEQNDAYVMNGAEKSLTLNDVKVGLGSVDSTTEKSLINFELLMQRQGKSFSNVRLLERGTYVRFLEMTPNVYEISWSDVVTITSERRAKNALSGVDRKLLLKSNREVSGQYAGETENTISLYQSNGVVETVQFDDIQKATFYGINPQQDIFAQSELLDIIHTNNQGEIRGVIIEKNYSNKEEKDNYVSIWVKDQSPQMVKFSEIAFLGREENKQYYQPKLDIILKDGEVVVNRKEVEYVNVREQGDILLLDSISEKVTIEKGTQEKVNITVEMKMGNVNAADVFQLVKVKKSSIKKDVFYGFSYKDLVNGSLRSTSVETSVNGTAKVEFYVNGDGIYALYDAKSKRAIPVVIK